MDQQRSTFVAIALILIVMAILGGTIYYLVRFVQSRQSPTNTVVTQSPTPSGNPNSTGNNVSTGNQPSAANNSNAPQTTSNPNLKVYSGEGYQLPYPKAWGLLTCNNSQNIELDPSNSTDNPKFGCDYAVKPITVMVYQNEISCPGSKVNIGNVSVIKSKNTQGNQTTYRWCTQTTPSLDITHRVSSISSPASSKADYSAQVEEMIARLNTSHGS
jgi:hypothetical protein